MYISCANANNRHKTIRQYWEKHPQTEQSLEAWCHFPQIRKNNMIVERENNKITVRFSANTSADKIQSILDYLRYEELTSKSTGTESKVGNLIEQAKSNRWEKTKISRVINLNQ